MHFVPFVAKMNLDESDRTRLIKAMASALRNDPFTLKSKIDSLPNEWREEIAALR
jgi:hypothetical protein